MNGQEEWHNSPIGVFDSGVGGLTVAREIMRQLPNERIVYFGDTARVPYGNKSRETVMKYSRQIVNFLKTQEVKAIVAITPILPFFVASMAALAPGLTTPMMGMSTSCSSSSSA